MGVLARLLTLLNIAKIVQGYPLGLESVSLDEWPTKRGISIDNAQDEWATLIAGVAPLVLLVGERVTKQHLRESSARADYYLLGASPFGLVTSVISLLRLVSLPMVNRLIGRSDELLQDTCKEITPVNTGNINSILEGGRVQRGTPETEQGPTGVSTNVVSRLHFWEFSTNVQELAGEIMRIRESLQQMDNAYNHSTDLKIPTHNALLVGEIETARRHSDVILEIKQLYGLGTTDDKCSKVAGTFSIKVTAVGGEVNFVGGEVRSSAAKVLLVLVSVASMLAIHILSLFDSDWQVTLGWVLVVAGYLGLLISVLLYADAIKQRIDTTSVQLGPHIPDGDTYCALQNGNLDQEGKSGYALPVSALGGVDIVKISTLRQPSIIAQLLGTFAGGSFLASFLIHYLGLRSVQWWVSICELAVCLVMVAVRTAVARIPVVFVENDASFDYDLRSVGVIWPEAKKRANVADDVSLPYQDFKCLRLFFNIRKMGVKTEGDTVAALLAAKLRSMESTSRQRIYDMIGFGDCQIVRLGNWSSRLVVIHCGGTGLLTTEGFVRPSEPLAWATEFALEQIDEESLIGWVIQGMNRNVKLQLLSQFKDLTNSAVYIPATNSIVDWWLRSEGSNEWEYNVRNLQWSGSLALAILLSKLASDRRLDKEVREKIERLLERATADPTLTAKTVANHFAESLEKLAKS